MRANSPVAQSDDEWRCSWETSRLITSFVCSPMAAINRFEPIRLQLHKQNFCGDKMFFMSGKLRAFGCFGWCKIPLWNLCLFFCVTPTVFVVNTRLHFKHNTVVNNKLTSCVWVSACFLLLLLHFFVFSGPAFSFICPATPLLRQVWLTLSSFPSRFF